MATLAEIYNWFMTGKKPTQAQFWATFGFFYNKGESIPQSAVSNLTNILNAKAEKSQLDAHKTDLNAHPELIAITRIIPYGEIQVFKTTPEGNQKEKEVGDYCVAWIENSLVSGNWNGGDEMLKSSYE